MCHVTRSSLVMCNNVIIDGRCHKLLSVSIPLLRAYGMGTGNNLSTPDAEYEIHQPA
jgi:hypothetical protein